MPHPSTKDPRWPNPEVHEKCRQNAPWPDILDHQQMFVLGIFQYFRGLFSGALFQEGKSAINLSNLGHFCQIWPRVIYLC